MIQGGGTLGTINLVKNGSGAEVVSGSNTYAGPTMINQGEMFVDGSLVSPVTVNSGGTLGGTGYLGGLSVKAGGQVAPGDSLGILHLSGNLALATGAGLDFDLDGFPTDDEISMPSGILTLGGQQFSNFHFTWSADFGPGVYTLIDAGSISGKLGSNLNGTIGDWDASIGLNTNGNELLLTVVPEPSTMTLLGAGLMGLIGWAWRRARQDCALGRMSWKFSPKISVGAG